MVRLSTEPSGSVSESREAPGAFTEDYSNHDENETDSWVLPSVEKYTTDHKGIRTITQTLDYINNKCHNLKLDIIVIYKRIVSIDNRLTRVESQLDKVDTWLDCVESRLNSIDNKLDRIEDRLERIAQGQLIMTEADQRAVNQYPNNPAFGQAAIRPYSDLATQIVVL
jgi:chromosome segregation ATPase